MKIKNKNPIEKNILIYFILLHGTVLLSIHAIFYSVDLND